MTNYTALREALEATVTVKFPARRAVEQAIASAENPTGGYLPLIASASRRPCAVQNTSRK